MSKALHDKHMELVDHVNASTTQQEYHDRGLVLQGFREYADFVNPGNTLRTWADLAVMDRGEERPLCCGVLFWDYTNNCIGAEDDELRDEDDPTDAQQELARDGHEASEARYRQQMQDAGRGHLLP